MSAQMGSSPGTTAELEGSTLGRNSRDESQVSGRINRNRSSGGFLLDSAYAVGTRNASSNQYIQRARGADGDKRRHAEEDLIVPKKRATPYGGQQSDQRSLKTSPLAAVTNVSTPEGHNSSQNESAASRYASSRNSHSSNVGLDTDPVQIVSLALNLSESRRRTIAGRTPSSPLPGIPRNASNNQGLFSPPDNPHRSLVGNKVPRRSSLYSQDIRQSPMIHEPLANTSSFAGFLPISTLQDVEIACSPATLARIEKAKQHFELFSKYLELLSFLPPLPQSPYALPSSGGRAYNPLQAIRNRKIRLREKNVIDTESEGWQDLSKVENWLASVEASLEPNKKDPYQCINLPPCPNTHGSVLVEEQTHTTTSPSSSARGANRSGTKVQRPRLDWVISPAELLADAVWLESDLNKTKVVDRNGEKLFPDPSKLKFAGSPSSREIHNLGHHNTRRSAEGSFTFPSSDHNRHETRSDHALNWSKSSIAQSTPDGAATAKGIHAPKWTRSSSLSDGSSSENILSRGRPRRSGRRAKLKSEAAIQAEKLHKVLHGHSDSSNARRSKPLSQPSSIKAGEMTDKSHTLLSPSGSVTGKEDRRMSIDELDSTAPNSPAQGPIFPSITTNLSPPSSRSPSPRKRLPRVIGSFHERTKSRRHNQAEQGEGLDESPSDFFQIRKRTTAESYLRDDASPRALQPSPLPELMLDQDYVSLDDVRRTDTQGAFKPYPGHESKLKGFLKNSRIAEIVGSEVSKVGDMIRRKDGNGHSRQSSYASSIASDFRESDEERSDGESVPSKRNSLRRGSTFSDDETGLPWHKSNGRASAKAYSSNLPSIGSSFRQNDQAEANDFDNLEQPESSRVSNVHFVRTHPSVPASSVDTTPYSERRDSYGFGAATRNLNTERLPKLHNLDNDMSSVAPGLRPPVTGLTNTEASTNKRPTLSTGGHRWSLSDRSVPTVNDINTLEKREVLRFQALLLSSGVKASEIVRRYQQSRDPPPKFLVQSLVDKDAPIPQIPRIHEFGYATRNLVQRLESTKTGLNKSMYHFSKSTLLPFEKEIANLEDLINNSLTPRVRTAAIEAESLSTQLNTTSTLAIKQLSESLDRGIRRRNRRLRSIRRAGFSLLEWTLVGVMWWVWLIVMIFKIIRGIGKGAVKSIRWMLWV